MTEDNRPPPITADQLAKNPSIDMDVVKQAHRARRQLEEMGVWEEGGSRVRSPFDVKPDIRPHNQRMRQLISQNQ